MIRNNRFFSVLLVIVLLLSGCQPLAPPSSPATTAYTPEFVPSACLYPGAPYLDTECGYLRVPEDRSKPAGKTIELYVMVIKSQAATPAAEPLILLNGGPGAPGQPVVTLLVQDGLGYIWGMERDVIYFDQRGTNFSKPALYCPEIEGSQTLTMTLLAASGAITANRTQNLQACYQRLRDEGIDLVAYNLFESAADVNDLRRVFGYEQVNLYGLSYGSLLAMTVAQQYPQTVHSLVLDSIWPPGVNLMSEKPTCIQSGLNAFFAGCAADVACQGAYPALAAQFYTVVDRLHAAPVQTIHPTLHKEYTILLDDVKFMNHVVGRLQSNQIARLPAEIAAAYQGDFTAVARTQFHAALARQLDRTSPRQSVAYGLYYSTMCSYFQQLAVFAQEEAPTCIDQPCLAPDNAALQRYADTLFTTCAAWPLPTRPLAATNLVVPRAIPILMLVGQYDSGLPPYLSEPLTAAVEQAYHYQLPIGHAAIQSYCGLQLATHFLTDPTQPPDASCIDDMRLHWLLPQDE